MVSKSTHFHRNKRYIKEHFPKKQTKYLGFLWKMTNFAIQISNG